jgi:hypothetical protein
MNVLEAESDGLNEGIAAVCAEVVALQSMLNSYIEDRVEMENELQRLEDAHSALTDNVDEAVCWFQSPHSMDMLLSRDGEDKVLSSFEIQLMETTQKTTLTQTETQLFTQKGSARLNDIEVESSIQGSVFNESSQCDEAVTGNAVSDEVCRALNEDSPGHSRTKQSVDVGRLTDEELRVGRNDLNYAYHSEGDNFKVNVIQMVR